MATMRLHISQRVKNIDHPALTQYCRYQIHLPLRNSSITELTHNANYQTQPYSCHSKSIFYNLTAHQSQKLLNLNPTLKNNKRVTSCSLSSGQPKFSVHKTFDGQPLSWLFVSNAAAGAYGAQVNIDLDLDRRLTDQSITSAIEENIQVRGIDFDVTNLKALYKQFKALEQKQKTLNARIQEILKLLKESEDVHGLKDSLVKELRHKRKDEAKSLMKDLWHLEEKLMLAALQLPNDLNTSTPLKRMEVIKESNGQTGAQADLTHIEIARKYDLIKFSNVGPKAYYLKRKLARAEMLLTDLANDYFHQHGYRLMLGPEFFKTPIMEGCGLDVYDTDKVLTMQHSSSDIEPMRHLAGISPMTFAAYVAKLNIGNSSLPLRMFSIGRRYQKGKLPGLFGACQSSQVGLFSCVSREQVEAEFDHMTTVVWDFLESFGFQIRLCQMSAKELERQERGRKEIQIFAPSLNDFIPVAWASDLGDFVSRRLMTFHSENHGDIRHGELAHMISGTALDITSLLAVWMETSYNGIGSAEFVLRELPPFLTARKKMDQF